MTATVVTVQVPHYTASMIREQDPPADKLEQARQARRRRLETRAADDLALIEWYEAVQDLLLDPATGKPWRGRYGYRSQIAKELGVDYNLLRHIERADTAHMRRELAERIAAGHQAETTPPG